LPLGCAGLASLITSAYTIEKGVVTPKFSKGKKGNFLTSDLPLKETVWGVFDLAEIVTWGSKN
jgi:hypothetical protein